MTARLGPIFLATLLTGCRAFGGSGADPNESDAGYIGIARNAPQVQAFYARYGGAAESVDRSGRLAVDFRASTARLRVFIENSRVVDAFVECPIGTVRTGDVVAAIRACP